MAAFAAAAAPPIPLCPGLTIVTAVSQPDGDYESIKTVVAVDDTGMRLKYSSEARFSDIFSAQPPTVRQVNVYRTVLAKDLATATSYQQIFMEKSDETIPGTTAIGVSAAVLKALKTTGKARINISNAYGGLQLKADRNVMPNYYQYMQPVTLARSSAGPATLSVLVNETPADLPIVRAEGDSFGQKLEFLILDDEKNPIALSFRIGVGALKPLTADERKYCESLRKSGADPASMPAALHCDRPEGGDRDSLRVVKIKYACATPASTTAAPGSELERALAEKGAVDVYSIYFSFNSDALRDESEPTLKEIADVLKRHAAWKLRVTGHTDGVGGDDYNLDLSRRRAAAVKKSLVSRYGIDAARLTTTGAGKSQPKDSNDTLEGRARNRRVELVRQ